MAIEEGLLDALLEGRDAQAVFSKDGMVDVTNKQCSHGSCTKQPSFNIEGVKGKYPSDPSLLWLG